MSLLWGAAPARESPAFGLSTANAGSVDWPAEFLTWAPHIDPGDAPDVAHRKLLDPLLGLRNATVGGIVAIVAEDENMVRRDDLLGHVILGGVARIVDKMVAELAWEMLAQSCHARLSGNGR